MRPVRRSQRLAAALALIAVGALIAAVTLMLWRNVVPLLTALGGVAVVALGGWWIVSERMPRRAVGAVAAVVGLVLVAVALVAALDDADRVLVRLGAVVALALVAVGSAHHALADGSEPRVTPAGGRRRPARPVLICNPWSGGGKVEQFGLVELAEELGVEVVMLDHGSDLETLARDAIARGADCLGMAGGDGSQALVAAIAIEHDLPFVCVSAGTRNHFALDLGLDREDPRASMNAFVDAVERRVDHGSVNGRLFVNNVSLGVYATVVQDDEYRDAKAATFATDLPELLGRSTEPFDLQFTSPTSGEVDGAFLILVSNNPYVLGPAVDNFQRRSVDTGRLGVVAVSTQNGRDAASLIAATAVGLRRHDPHWHEFLASEFVIRSRSGTAFVGVDGEALEMSTPLNFAVHPGALRLFVPDGNLEAAERRRSRDMHVADLVTVALHGRS